MANLKEVKAYETTVSGQRFVGIDREEPTNLDEFIIHTIKRGYVIDERTSLGDLKKELERVGINFNYVCWGRRIYFEADAWRDYGTVPVFLDNYKFLIYYDPYGDKQRWTYHYLGDDKSFPLICASEKLEFAELYGLDFDGHHWNSENSDNGFTILKE